MIKKFDQKPAAIPSIIPARMPMVITFLLSGNTGESEASGFAKILTENSWFV